jgi:hypothetical protein
MIDWAEKVIPITNHTKIGKVSFAKFADIHEINYLITDSRLYLTTLKNQEFLFAQYDFSPIGKDLISDKRKKWRSLNENVLKNIHIILGGDAYRVVKR